MFDHVGEVWAIPMPNSFGSPSIKLGVSSADLTRERQAWPVELRLERSGTPRYRRIGLREAVGGGIRF